MSYPFIDRPPTGNELERIRLAMSSYCDGSGFLLEKDGRSRPASRDFERIFAELFDCQYRYDKGLFDLTIPGINGKDCGISIKSKCLERASAIEDLLSDGRLYMELSNAPSRNEKALRAKGYTRSDYDKKSYPQEIGNELINYFNSIPFEVKTDYEKKFPGRTLDLARSCFLTISYSELKKSKRKYQIHAFRLELPTDVVWEYTNSGKGLMGTRGGGRIYEWYPFSGGQFKYMPLASDAFSSSTQFYLETPRKVSVIEKTSRYWPNQWVDADGSQDIDIEVFIEELQRQKLLVSDKQVKRKIEDVLGRLRELV